MDLVIIVIIALAVIYKLGLFNPIQDLASVATRESSKYNRKHKEDVAKVYETMSADIDVEKVNENIKKIDSLNFD